MSGEREKDIIQIIGETLLDLEKRIEVLEAQAHTRKGAFKVNIDKDNPPEALIIKPNDPSSFNGTVRTFGEEP